MRTLRFVAMFAVLNVATAYAGDRVVLEVSTGPRPDDASRVLSPVLDELASREFVTGADVVGRKFEAQVSRAALAPGGLPADFADQVERGHREWISGKFDDAVAILSPLVEAAHASPGAFAQDQQLRDRLLKALFALALSQNRMGEPDAAELTFREILRSFPDATLSRGSYGPEAFNLFEQLRKKFANGSKGRLLVKVSNETAVVFINERYEHVGTTVKELLPGEYRVFTRVGKTLSRNHRVVVKPNEETTVTIDAEFDRAVHTSPKWAGLQFDTAADREKFEASYAATLAAAIDARAVVIVGIDQVKGRPAIVGALINLLNGREIRRASLALEPNPPVERLRTLARFLAGEEATGGIDVQINSEAAGPIGRGPDTGGGGGGGVVGGNDRVSTGRWGGWMWITGGLTVAAVGTGAVLLAQNGKCPGGVPHCVDVYDNAAPGWVAVGAGAVLAGVTIYLFATRTTSPSGRTAFIVPTGDGAVAGFSTRF
jgi:hypothetical protein